MLLVNISREKILLAGKGFSEELAYLDIERKLAPLLVSIIEKYAITSIWVINGPGSFTTLRLGCLTVETIRQFGSSKLAIYACSKLDIYTYAIEKGLISSLGLVYIGQKKNMRKVRQTTDNNLQSSEENMNSGNSISIGWQAEIINQENLDMIEGEDYFIDACEHILVDVLGREKMVTWEFDGEELVLEYRGSSCNMSVDTLGLQARESLEPKYMMSPQIG